MDTIPLHRMDVSWAVHRLPKAVARLLERQGKSLFLAGGFIRACIAREEINDIDIFCGSAEVGKALAKELAAEKPGCELYETDNAITVTGFGLTVQFITRWTFSDVEDCIESFDFTIAQAAIWFEDNGWSSAACATYYQDLAAKRLVYTSPIRVEETGGSLLRVLKFYQRGYRIPLDSLGAVVARCVSGVRHAEIEAKFQPDDVEDETAAVITSLLREVDPSIRQESSHLPPMTQAA